MASKSCECNRDHVSYITTIIIISINININIICTVMVACTIYRWLNLASAVTVTDSLVPTIFRVQTQPVLLGEGAGKIVPHSPVRFPGLGLQSAGRSFTSADGAMVVVVEGEAGESVNVSFWLDGKVLTATCVFAGSGVSVAHAGVSAAGTAYCTHEQ